jgi:hypothetical protein
MVAVMRKLRLVFSIAELWLCSILILLGTQRAHLAVLSHWSRLSAQFLLKD